MLKIMKGGGNLQLAGLARKIKSGKSDEEVINEYKEGSDEKKLALRKLFDDMETNTSMLGEEEGKNKWETGVKVDNGKGTELNWVVKPEEYSRVYNARNIRDSNKAPGGTNLKPKTLPPPSDSQPTSGKGTDKLRVKKPPLNASSDSSKVTIDELLKDMEEFQKELVPLVDKSSTTYGEVTKYVTKLISDIDSGKANSNTITAKLKDQNTALQVQLEKVTKEKTELEQQITQQTQKNGETAQQILDLQNEIEQKIQEVKEKEEINKTLAEDKVQNQIQSAEQEAVLQSDLNKLTTEKRELTQKLEQQTNDINNMKEELTKVAKIQNYFEGIKQQTNSLVKHNDSIKQYIEDKNRQNGGYQYKSKNKSRSRRRYKGNRFGLLKSKSKTKKGKKKKKKNKNIKGGMKTRSKPKRKSKKGKKTRKGKKKNNKRK